MRVIHQKIADAVFGSGEVKIAPKVSVKDTNDGNFRGVYYCDRLCAAREKGGRGGYIINQDRWDSPTAMGYYRALFGTDEIRKVKGEVKLPDGITLL